MEDFIPLFESTPHVKKDQKRPLKHKFPLPSTSVRKKNRMEKPKVPKMVQLHEEILNFCDDVRPLQKERMMRADLIKRIRISVTSLWPHAKLEVFGSYTTDLYLPSCDIDLVVFGRWNAVPLYSLKRKLVEDGISTERDAIVIAGARVPIVKIVDTLTNVKVDITFNNTSGIHGAEQTNIFLQKYRNAKPLILIIKHFLSQRDLNEVFKGGVSSYGVVLMVLSFLQLHPRGEGDNPHANLGVLLIEFFELYGLNMNYFKTGIRLRDQYNNLVGSYFRRSNIQHRAFALPIIDPNTTSGEENDVMKGSYKLFQVQLAFKHAYFKLFAELQNPLCTDSLLSTIIDVNIRS